MEILSEQKSALLKLATDQFWRMHNLYSIRTKVRGYEGKRVTFTPNKVQKQIYQALEDGWKRILIVKPRKMGITTGVAIYLLDKALYSPNQLCRTIAHRKQTVTELFHDIPRFAINSILESNPILLPELDYSTKSEIVVKRTGSKYSIDVEARGMTPTYLHFSEVAYMEDEAKLQDSMESLSSNNVCICESTANGKGNWFERTAISNWELMQKGETPEWLVFFFPWFDDPENSLFLQPGFKLYFPDDCLELQAKYKNSDGSQLTLEQIAWWDRKKFELGSRMPELYPSCLEEAFIFNTGKVYPEFSSSLNVVPRMSFDNPVISMDYGQTNPMVFLFSSQDNDDNFTVWKEFYRRDCPIPEAAAWLKKYAKVEDGFVQVQFPDPSIFNKNQVSFIYRPGEDHRYSIADEFRRYNIICRPGTQNDVLAGIVRVKEYLKFDPNHPHPYKRNEDGTPFLGSPRFFITEDCVNTIEEFGLYRWPKDKTGNLDQSSYEAPIKKNDHAMDAIKYLILSSGRPISEENNTQRGRQRTSTDLMSYALSRQANQNQGQNDEY